MVTYSAAPLHNSNVALIEPHAFRSLSSHDGVAIHKIFNALGISKVIAKHIKEIGENEDARNDFFRKSIEASTRFKENEGLYIAEDIEKALASNSIIAKISLTDSSVEEGGDVNGGVAAFVLPSNKELNSICVTSGGLTRPAFMNNVGVSVVPTDYVFTNVSETLFTLTSILLGNVNEESGTNWAEAENVSFTIYSVKEDSVKKVYQSILRQSSSGELTTKEAFPNKDGFLPTDGWVDLEGNVVGFVNTSHERLASVLNEIGQPSARLGVVGDDSYENTSDEKRFVATIIDGSAQVHNADAFGYDEHPVAAQDEYVLGEDNSISVEQHSASSNDVETPSDIISQAEYEVTHSQEPTYTTDVNDASAETESPFDLGAAYLINETVNESQTEEAVHEPEGNLVDSHEQVDELVQQTETLLPPNEQTFEELQWSEVITGNVDVVQDDHLTDDTGHEFSDITWDEVALTVADDNQGEGGKPLRGFI